MTEIAEELIAVVHMRAAHELGSALAAEFLSILADRGVITHRDMVKIAREIAKHHDMGEVTGPLIDEFARAVGLEPFPPEEEGA